MDPIEAARSAWDEATEPERQRMFVQMYAYLTVLDPIDLFTIELRVRQ